MTEQTPQDPTQRDNRWSKGGMDASPGYAERMNPADLGAGCPIRARRQTDCLGGGVRTRVPNRHGLRMSHPLNSQMHTLRQSGAQP